MKGFATGAAFAYLATVPSWTPSCAWICLVGAAYYLAESALAAERQRTAK